MEDNNINNILNEDSFTVIEENASEYLKLMYYYKCAIMEVETKFKVLNEGYFFLKDRNPITSIKSRIKSPKSIMEKLKKNNFPFTFSSIEKNLNDVAGIRIICSFLSDVYTVADSLLRQDDIKLIAKKDYIKNPKPNGYRSLHLIIEIPIFLSNEKKEMKVEIQIRTIAMDFWATLEHQIKYKKNIVIESDVLDELLNCAVQTIQLDEKMDNLRKKVLEN